MRHMDVRLGNGVTVETWVPSWKVMLAENKSAIAAVIASAVAVVSARIAMRHHR
jgi:hypothetical protein